MLYKQIVDQYKQCESMRQTSEKLDVAISIVRKVLVTEGLWTSSRIETIMDLREAGLTEKEIAEKLHVSTSCVNSNSPYTKGTYLDSEKSINAQRIRECRKKKKAQMTSDSVNPKAV